MTTRQSAVGTYDASKMQDFFLKKLENLIGHPIIIKFDIFNISGLLTDFQNQIDKFKVSFLQENGNVDIYFIPHCVKIKSINKK